MTTISFKDGVMAADSRITKGDCKLEGAIKICPLSPDIIYGIVGSITQHHAVNKWIAGRFNAHGNDMLSYWEAEDCLQGVQLLVAMRAPDGDHLYVLDEDGVVEVPQAYYALGTGSDFALGAMEAGVGAVAATQIAIRYDLYSGGPVLTRELSQTEMMTKAS